MALNHLMHPRNVYKNRPPDFRVLAEKYPDFRQYATFAPDGKVSLDFHNSDAVRCLTEKLLKEDFKLDVILPVDALVPRIPQRLDYILLVQDLLNASNLYDNVLGIDIGTGPSCVYPLLGAKHCKWNFCATEVNEESVAVALKNVEKNQMNDKITIFQGDESTFFKEIFKAYPDKIFSFSMCNPPFFNKEECEERFQRSDKSDFKNNPNASNTPRAPPSSATVARNSELWVHGGEVDFVTRMIHESALYPSKVQLYTSMIGKKMSISPLKKVLEEYKNLIYATHCIAQGRTKRWVLVWTFNPTIKVNSRLANKTLSFSKNKDDVISFFCQICKWANVEVSKHSSGYLICFIPSSKMLSFKPWKTKKRKNDNNEVPKKFMKIHSPNTQDRAEINSNISDKNNADSQLSVTEVTVNQPQLVDAKNIRLVVNKNANSSSQLNVEFFNNDMAGFRWLESLINYVNGNPNIFPK
uniref:U6 small nuclear RNA (adenine-(43)-N(6))-methyltransferase n=1 Tax=Panagrolaimus superbus TaxID=310955 RepID=A0A914YV84_9BILA